jgi:hypothetical protein
MSKLLEHSHVLTATNTFNNNDHQLVSKLKTVKK